MEGGEEAEGGRQLCSVPSRSCTHVRVSLPAEPPRVSSCADSVGTAPLTAAAIEAGIASGAADAVQSMSSVDSGDTGEGREEPSAAADIPMLHKCMESDSDVLVSSTCFDAVLPPLVLPPLARPDADTPTAVFVQGAKTPAAALGPAPAATVAASRNGMNPSKCRP